MSNVYLIVGDKHCFILYYVNTTHCPMHGFVSLLLQASSLVGFLVTLL